MAVPQARRDSVPLRYVRTLLRVAEEQGYDQHSIARQLNLPVELLSPRADPTSQVPAEYYNRAYTFVMDMLQDESLGISMRHPSVSGSFRMTCLYLIHCQNLEHALQRATEFQNFCRSMVGQQQSYREPVLMLDEEFCIHLFPDSSEFAAQDSDLAWYAIAHTMAVWRRFCSWLIGSQIELQAVHIQLPKPGTSGSLKQIFECPILFNQDYNGFVFDRSYLKAPLVHDEDSLKQFLRNAPYHLLANTEVESDDGIVTQMRRIVGNDLSREFPSVVDMANHLHMSVRTLRRRLKEVGTTYQQFKDLTRRDAAMQLLNRPELKINAIAALLGFDEPSAFHRSFKKWTGATPGDYRKSLQD
jgi:AraC-like DNA-binding protein